ncbi:hypothetical protein BC937DRAFT_89189 [Endogone sp. FLAS-F59071]|nr:hypothetical protein BC937DRAFT_89189 [Endogone sp. FLAS-F59071]|eukprot:RUS18052.1 hypothetical protein BC937DRAFT_89189 [Endogone sp. FLAS-F59071]
MATTGKTNKGYYPVIWDLNTNDWELGTAGSLTTNASEDATFQKWVSAVPQDTHGHIHELSASSVGEAIRNIPVLKQFFTVVQVFQLNPVATCIRDSHPYRENITFPILAPNSTSIITLDGTTTSSAVAIATTVPASISGAPSPSSSQGTGVKAWADVWAGVVVGAGVVIASTWLL